MNKVYDIVTDKIINALENGIIPWRKPWQSSLPCNLVSKRPYNGINLFLLALMPYSSPYWLTFKQAKEKGGKVIKGERSTLIVFWKPTKFKDKDGEEKTIPILRYYNVFNVEQCEGIEVPNEGEKLDFIPVNEAEKLASKYCERESLEVKCKEQNAYYSPSLDYVNMPNKTTFESVGSYYSVLFHELAHSTGHKSRLDRLELSTFGSDPYAKEELVAEMTAAFACSTVGIDNTLQNSTAYIQNWLKKLKSDPKLVIEASAKARKAFEYMADIQKVEA
jgi:antirestriction protein ArdC